MIRRRILVALGAVAALFGLVGIFWLLAIDGPWAVRGRIPQPIDWVIALVLLVGGAAVLVSQGRMSAFDVLVGVLGAALVGNLILAAADSGHLNCAIGPEPTAKPDDTALVAIPQDLLHRAVTVQVGDPVRIIIVARHKKANDEEAIETTSYKGTYREAPQGQAAGKPRVELTRGTNDADLAIFLGALADAVSVALYDRSPDATPHVSRSCW